MTRPFRFALSLGEFTDPTEVIAAARKAEDLGYAGVAMPDHLDGQFAPFPVLTAAAAATTTLTLTTLVLGNDYRHPAFVAQEAATLDLLSGGRLELGIGAGWMRSDYDQAGMAYEQPSVRIARLAESVSVIKGLMADGPYSFRGEHYQITELDGFPKPHQRPHPPFLIAGGGPKILALAGREADIVGLNPGLAAGVIDERAGATATPAATDEKLAWVKEAAGDRFDTIELQTRVHLALITDDREGTAEALAPALGLTAADALGTPHALVGTVEQCIETVQGWRERWGISYVSFTADAMDTMAPVVARLAGT
jgi:probable F420-dependent oxidoreductase